MIINLGNTFDEIDDHANILTVNFDYDDLGISLLRIWWDIKAFHQIDDRQHFPAQVGDTLDELRRLGDG